MNSKILSERSKCIDCADRYPACQDHCEYGQALKKARLERKHEEWVMMRGDTLARNQQVDSIMRYKRSTGYYRKRR